MLRLKNIAKSIGPGFIMAAVVLGPGSITTASKIGSTEGYAFLWVILLGAISMAVYSNMSTRFGVLHEKSILKVISEKYSKWLSLAIGIASFFASLSFQFGNNLGVGMGMEALTGIDAKIWPLIFTPGAIVLIFFAKNLYKTLEKLMMFMVMFMILAFIINLIFIKPDLTAIASGFVPKGFLMDNFNQLAALVGTTFVLHCAIYQAYLVQDKGWKRSDKDKGVRDSNLGVFMLALMSSLVIITAAATLKPMGITINSAGDMALQLELLLGSYAKYVFALGFISAAFSSLLVNSVIGGGLLADSIGMGRSMEEKMPKLFTTIILIVGMAIALYVSGNGSPVYSLIMAQASSILAVPLIAIGLYLVLNNKEIMGKYKNTNFQNVLAIAGFVLICVLVYIMYGKLIGYVGNM